MNNTTQIPAVQAFYRKVCGFSPEDANSALKLKALRLDDDRRFALHSRETVMSRLLLWNALTRNDDVMMRMSPGAIGLALNYSHAMFDQASLPQYVDYAVSSQLPLPLERLLVTDNIWRLGYLAHKTCPDWAKDNHVGADEKILYAGVLALMRDGRLEDYTGRAGELLEKLFSPPDDLRPYGDMTWDELHLHLSLSGETQRVVRGIEAAVVTGVADKRGNLPLNNNVRDWTRRSTVRGADTGARDFLSSQAWGQYVAARATAWAKPAGIPVEEMCEAAIAGYARGLANYTPVVERDSGVFDARRREKEIQKDLQQTPLFHLDEPVIAPYVLPSPTGACDAEINLQCRTLRESWAGGGVKRKALSPSGAELHKRAQSFITRDNREEMTWAEAVDTAYDDMAKDTSCREFDSLTDADLDEVKGGRVMISLNKRIMDGDTELLDRFGDDRKEEISGMDFSAYSAQGESQISDEHYEASQSMADAIAANIASASAKLRGYGGAYDRLVEIIDRLCRFRSLDEIPTPEEIKECGAVMRGRLLNLGKTGEVIEKLSTLFRAAAKDHGVVSKLGDDNAPKAGIDDLLKRRLHLSLRTPAAGGLVRPTGQNLFAVGV